MFSDFKDRINSIWSSAFSRLKRDSVPSYVFYLLTIFVFVFLVVGLFNLQISEGRQNLLAATRTSQSTELVLPPRGIIYDETGTVLAYNSPSYAVYIDSTIVESESERKVISKISNIVSRDENDLLNAYRNAAYDKDSEEKIIKLIGGLSSSDYFKLIEMSEGMEGVEIVSESQRRYPESEIFSHILGYVGKPAESDLGEGVYTISSVGKDGVERIYDKYLRGDVGVEVIQKQLSGNTNSVENTFTQEEWVYGDNVYLNIDTKWQKTLSNIMQQRLEETQAFASAGVVMNSDTGEVKALVSLPSFDNNLFVDAIKTDQYNKLTSDVRTPLLNRAIALQLPSGSIFKVVGATAALEEQVVSKDTILRSEGCMQLSSEIKFCEADGKVLGDLNIVSALGKSSNLYFCKAAIKLNNNADGIYSILKYAKKFGLGDVTGIDLLGEQKGTLPSPELKTKLFGENWYVGDDCNSMIGQGLLTVTPIQMAVLASAVNNGGKVLEPQILDRVEDQTGRVVEDTKPVKVRDLDVSKENLEIIRQGMELAANEGTAWQLNDLPGDIIAKTGSADASEVIDGKLYSGAHSWVMGCFDMEEENYCFVFMQQWGGRGFQTVPVAKKFINCVQTDFSPKCSEID